MIRVEFSYGQVIFGKSPLIETGTAGVLATIELLVSQRRQSADI